METTIDHSHDLTTCVKVNIILIVLLLIYCNKRVHTSSFTRGIEILLRHIVVTADIQSAECFVKLL